jgi:hypothetical protein
MKKNLSTLKFSFDRDRKSSTIIIFGEINDFQVNSFLKKHYGINHINDEGEAQNYVYLTKLKTIKKVKDKFSFGIDYIYVDLSNLNKFISEIFKYNFGEIWNFNGKKYDCICNLNEQSEIEIIDNLKILIQDGITKRSAILFESVIF